MATPAPPCSGLLAGAALSLVATTANAEVAPASGVSARWSKSEALIGQPERASGDAGGAAGPGRARPRAAADVLFAARGSALAAASAPRRTKARPAAAPTCSDPSLSRFSAPRSTPAGAAPGPRRSAAPPHAMPQPLRTGGGSSASRPSTATSTTRVALRRRSGPVRPRRCVVQRVSTRLAAARAIARIMPSPRCRCSAAPGFADRDLYLVIVRDLVRRADHAVLVARAEGRMFVLDNGTDNLLDSAVGVPTIARS